MFWFRKKVNRSIEQLIFDIAEHKKQSDIGILVSKLAGKQLFAPLPESMKEASENKRIETYQADGTSKFQWPYVKIENFKFAQCLSGKDNSICNGNAISITFEDMKSMISKLNLDGLYIHDGTNSWCVITKKDLA